MAMRIKMFKEVQST